MTIGRWTLCLAVVLFSFSVSALGPQDDLTRKNAQTASQTTQTPPQTDSETEGEGDDFTRARWHVQRTAPMLVEDLDSSALDLHQPENIRQTVEYDDSTNTYIIGSKIGDTYLNAPVLMTPEEYRQWSERRALREFFRKKDQENVEQKGESKFSFADMHFDLGPAEKIFGPGGVRIKTQGTAELKLGATMKNIDNPSLPIRNRKTTSFDFDEKINFSANAKVGDKVNMNLNYNTDATFDFDTQNLKLKYEGKEDEIIKLVEGGNVTFPSNNSLVKGATSLFGIRTDMQFGRLKLQTVISQKKSSTKSVSSKGGTSTTAFELDVADYEENRHFFLARYFRENYDAWMQKLPNLLTGINITRVEVWVTNKTATTSNTRNLVALTDLGESQSARWGTGLTSASSLPSNTANGEYGAMTSTYADARDPDLTSSVFEGVDNFEGGVDYEKLSSARLLNSSEYTVNTQLGYISLKTGLQTDQVLAVAYEFTYGGVPYQVGEFASDLTDTGKSLYVKTLKNTSNNPTQQNWPLMMKNVYYLASTVEKTKFRLDIKFQSDTAGVYLSYIPETKTKSTPLIRLLGADRLDNNNQPHSNGYFDFVQGYTVSNGRVFLPAAEPFGSCLRNKLLAKGLSASDAEKYVFSQLYDSTKTVAKQNAEKDKFIMTGQFKGTSANVIQLNSYNVPQGSVVVTAGGVTLQEGSDYTVDYSAGEVTILNQSIIDAGTNISVSLESNTDYGMQRKTMLGLNWEYDFSKNFQLGGTIMHLSEQALTSKVTMGSEPLKNTLWGLNVNWKQDSQWLTSMLDKIPFLHVTQPSHITFTGEFAQLIAGTASGTQDNASYIDDFENTKNKLDVSSPKQWMLASVPTMIPDYNDKTSVRSGYNRALLAWYNIDPLFTRRSSTLTPSHIKSDMQMLSNHYMREVYVKELYPNRDQSTYNGATSTLPILNLAYYPQERGPYNLTLDLNTDGTLRQPETKWGGMMRKLETTDFEQANIEYIEFWLLDPFIYSRQQANASDYGGDLYFNLGEISEDVLRDGKKFYESGMAVDGSSSYAETQWGRIPVQATQTYAFATTSGSRAMQDVGLNGLTDEQEQQYGAYKEWLDALQSQGIVTNDSVLQAWRADPAGDDYHYFRGDDFDEQKLNILERYKRINNTQGNSPDSNSSGGYDASYTSSPDVEDINRDFTLNEYERFYQYRVRISPEVLDAYLNGTASDDCYITDVRESSVKLRNDSTVNVHWFQFRIPLTSKYRTVVGGISDLTSIRFMRMFLTGFQKPVVLRFGSLDLVRGEWRLYKQSLSTGVETGTMNVSAVNIEENNDKVPVNYVLPPGISRATDPSQPQLVENNEQAMDMVVHNLATGEAKAVYKNTSLDLRQYKRLQMFAHANHLVPDVTALQDNQLALFIRLGSDYKTNYYEYEIPLRLTPDRSDYNKYSNADRQQVWPVENMLDIPISVFTKLKKERNLQKATGAASYNQLFSQYDEDHPANKVSVVGNPSLGEVKTMMIGVRNISGEEKSGEVWVNEMRLLETENEGGWAASGSMNVQLSDFGSVNLTGRYVSDGFGGLEEGVMQRSTDTQKQYSITTQFELGKFFPDKAKVSAPLYYSVTKEEILPRYNPLDTDMKLKDALDAAANEHERDSIESIAVTKTTNTNFALSNIRWGLKTKRHPMPYDPANFSFSYSHSHRYTSGETTVYEKEDQWRGALNYNYSPVYKPWEPFKQVKGKSKWLEFPKALGFNYLPQNISFNSELTRNYYELQERDLEALENQQLPLTFNSQFLWNRDFSLRWDFTKNLHFNFQSATHAQIEEPYTPVNKDLYPDRYEAWKDSVRQSILNLGTPLDYQQQTTLSYQLPLNKLPIFDWLNADANYTANYSWVRGTELDDGTSLGNTITSRRNLNINGSLNLETLYNHIPFLKKANDRFKKAIPKKTRTPKKAQNTGKPGKPGKPGDSGDSGKPGKSDKQSSKPTKEEAALPKNKNTYQREITLRPDTTITVAHNKRSKRIIVTARTKDGKPYKIKYKVLDDNKILVRNLDTVSIKLSVTPKPSAEKQWWYRPAQSVARLLMMVRSINISYRDQYSMLLPGFMPNIGDAFGQRTSGGLSPGLDFAFGLAGDGYLDKAIDRGWMLSNDSVATPANVNSTSDLQLRAVLEPMRDLKIDLNASRTDNRARSIQYMYAGRPTTHSGSFNMTTISLHGALEGMGDADNGYHSGTFEKFCDLLGEFQQRVQAQYEGVDNPALGTVNPYSADVMVPAFLSAYTMGAGNSLSIFPALTRLLPNWTLRYSGLSKLTWFSNHFKSFNINHSYKSVYSVGSYASYSSWQEYMNGLGFITDQSTGQLQPSSMYNVSTVSINEAFSPLLGIDATLQNDLTLKFEYRRTRVLNLSMTSVQINESRSNDWVIGAAYKLKDFNLFGAAGNRKVSKAQRGKSKNNSTTSRSTARSGGVNHDLNLRLDISFRKQAAITRDIATRTSSASSGNSAFKLSFMADYTLSRLLTLSAYFDQQTNTPLLSSSSYPTTTRDFGLSVKFSLTR
ncbi:MAG: cell surface protein SprA [Prevotella sp.]|nr:cell surface protein SprA [Prevotella sp.]